MYLRDTESGNDAAPAREFINRLGRFSVVDPMGGNSSNPQSLNRYAYAMNDPIDLLDPEGEYVCITYCGGGGPFGIWGGGGAPGEGWFDLDASYAGGSSIDGGWAPSGFANGVAASGGAVQCPGNACSDSSYTTVYFKGQLVDAYWQTWDFRAFIQDSQYYAESGPGAMYTNQNAAGIAAGSYFFGASQADDLEFGGWISQDANGFYIYDLSTIGGCSFAGCLTNFSQDPDGLDNWHTHPLNNDSVIQFAGDRASETATPPDYVTNNYGTFLIGAWPGGAIHGPVDTDAGPEVLGPGQIAPICQLTGSTPFPGVSSCHQ
jgi:RHS repeat-associated protein